MRGIVCFRCHEDRDDVPAIGPGAVDLDEPGGLCLRCLTAAEMDLLVRRKRREAAHSPARTDREHAQDVLDQLQHAFALERERRAAAVECPLGLCNETAPGAEHVPSTCRVRAGLAASRDAVRDG